jgi:hypothetical protein
MKITMKISLTDGRKGIKRKGKAGEENERKIRECEWMQVENNKAVCRR